MPFGRVSWRHFTTHPGALRARQNATLIMRMPRRKVWLTLSYEEAITHIWLTLNCAGCYSVLAPQLWPYRANALTTFTLFIISYVNVNYYNHKLLHPFQGKKMTQKILLLLKCTGFYSVLVLQLWPYTANTLTTFSPFRIRYVNIYYYNHKLLYTL